MSIKSIQTSFEPKNNVRKNDTHTPSFKGAGINPVVGLMDFIDRGGFAASFILQDGIGFVAPRVGKGILRGGKEKTDENGNVILDKNGKPKHEYNWEFARKEGLRELLTGPSAFLIPLGLLSFINRKFGTANSVKLNYIDSFKPVFTDFVKQNKENILADKADKSLFYKDVLKDTIEQSINKYLPDNEKLSADELENIAKEFSQKQIKIEDILKDKSLNKKQRAEKIKEIGTVEDAYMKLRKNKIGGTVNEISVNISASNKALKQGSIGELLTAMNNYYKDAVNNVKTALNKNSAVNIDELLKNFTHRKMGSRFFTNMSMYSAVVAFFTLIPKLYNLGLKSNPGLKGTAADPKNMQQNDNKTDNKSQKNVAFKGNIAKLAEKTGEKVFNNSKAKAFSDIFEFNGPVIPGTAMVTLLYGFCIPPRLIQAQDKYDRSEIMFRDFTSFTALLFGSSALSRLFSDGFTKLTGLALNKKEFENKSLIKKIGAYLNPSPYSGHHTVLKSKQLNSKYTNIHEYKDGINGFMEFVENSGGNIKKAFAIDKNVKEIIDKILQQNFKKSYNEATKDEIKQALKSAHEKNTDLIQSLYKVFEGDNKLLRRAKTCNSAFGFLSTIVLVPSFIIWVTNVCERMTRERTKKDAELSNKQNKTVSQTDNSQIHEINTHPISSKPSMAGFLKN